MTSFGITTTINEKGSEPNGSTDAEAVDSLTKQPTESAAAPNTELSSAHTEPSASRKTPVSNPKQAASKKATTKKVTAQEVNSVNPVATKSSVQKPAATKKAVSTKAGANASPTAKRKSSAKKTTAGKSAAKETPKTYLNVKKAAGKKRGPVKTKVGAPQVSKASPVAPSQKSSQDAGKVKAKLVRDSFTMPADDFGLIAVLKARALGFKRPAKKSELLRAGLHALQQLTNAQFHSALDSLEPLKAGRPKKKAN